MSKEWREQSTSQRVVDLETKAIRLGHAGFEERARLRILTQMQRCPLQAGRQMALLDVIPLESREKRD